LPFSSRCPKRVGVPKGWVFLPPQGGNCTVSSENYILIPVINTFYAAFPWENQDLEDAIDIVKNATDYMKGSAIIDGKKSKMVRLFGTDNSFDSLCTDDIDGSLGLEPPKSDAGAPTAGDGYYVVIKPLRKGKHVIKLRGSVGTVSETKYFLTSK